MENLVKTLRSWHVSKCIIVLQFFAHFRLSADGLARTRSQGGYCEELPDQHISL